MAAEERAYTKIMDGRAEEWSFRSQMRRSQSRHWAWNNEERERCERERNREKEKERQREERDQKGGQMTVDSKDFFRKRIPLAKNTRENKEDAASACRKWSQDGEQRWTERGCRRMQETAR